MRLPEATTRVSIQLLTPQTYLAMLKTVSSLHDSDFVCYGLGTTCLTFMLNARLRRPAFDSSYKLTVQGTRTFPRIVSLPKSLSNNTLRLDPNTGSRVGPGLVDAQVV